MQKINKETHQDYDAIIAYFMNDPQSKLESLKKLNKPLVIFHHSPLDTSDVNWYKKIRVLSIPVPVGKLSDSLLELINHNTSNELLRITPFAKHRDIPTAVLVVEDNLTNQLVVKGMLRHLGMKPDIANNGQEAVEMAAQRKYEVILMDCEMPIMDGFKASRIIMENSQHPKPYIAALTAHTLQETGTQCERAGIQSVLHKPITVERLSELFNTVT